MKKELWVIDFESANYAGAGEYCLVWASSKEEAEIESCEYTENFYYEQDSEQYKDEYGDDDEGVCWSFLNDVYPLASEKADDIRDYIKVESQRVFYPIINDLN